VDVGYTLSSLIFRRGRKWGLLPPCSGNGFLSHSGKRVWH
jgi:hypothetical protein